MRMEVPWLRYEATSAGILKPVTGLRRGAGEPSRIPPIPF
jgi:hypothetical protein